MCLEGVRWDALFFLFSIYPENPKNRATTFQALKMRFCRKNGKKIGKKGGSEKPATTKIALKKLKALYLRRKNYCCSKSVFYTGEASNSLKLRKNAPNLFVLSVGGWGCSLTDRNKPIEQVI